MRGVVAGLQAIKGSGRQIRVIVPQGNFPSCISTTPFEDIRQPGLSLIQTHYVDWSIDREDLKIIWCQTESFKAAARYNEACALVSPALPLIREACEIFNVNASEVVLKVRAWIGLTDEGEDVFGDDAPISLPRGNKKEVA